MRPAPSSSKIWLVALLALPLGATGLWSWNLQRDAGALRASAASLSAEQTRLNGEVIALTQRREALRRDLVEASSARSEAEASIPAAFRKNQAVLAAIAELRKRAASATRSDASAVPLALPSAPSGLHGNVYFPELFSDPHYAQLYLVYLRHSTNERFAPLFASLQLPPAERVRFKELLIQQQMASEEVDGVMENQAMREKKPFDRSEAMQVKLRVNRTFDDEIKQTFGDAVFAEYREFLNGAGARQAFLDRLTLRLSYSGAPLETAQANQLTALYSASRRVPVASGGTPLDLSDDFMAGAQSILKPEQRTALEQINAESRASRTAISSTSIRRPPAAPLPGR